MEGDVLYVDIAPWAEDREELRELRDTVQAAHEDVKRIASRLERDARKIHKACDLIDHMSHELDRTAQTTAAQS